jgi:hypothetical protein
VTQWNPGDRVCSIVDFDYGTVVEAVAEHPGYYLVKLDHPDYHGDESVMCWGGDLEREKTNDPEG